MYNEKVIRVFKNPKNAGGLQGANGVGKVNNETCGDIIKFYFRFNDNGVLEEAKFKTFGSVAAIASSSVATELVKGKSLIEILKITSAEIINAVGELPQDKVYCATLAEEGIKAACEDYTKRKLKEDNKI